MVAPQITRLARLVEEAAQVAAPPEKVWTTQGDNLVRRWHRTANRQAVPDNLRFTLDSPLWSQENEGTGPTEMGRYPGDEALSYLNTVYCRCFLTYVPDGVSRTIAAEPAKASGTTVRALVRCTHRLAVNAEFGNDEDQGVRFMAAGVRHAALRIR
jgi:hypothetical protein